MEFYNITHFSQNRHFAKSNKLKEHLSIKAFALDHLYLAMTLS